MIVLDTRPSAPRSVPTKRALDDPTAIDHGLVVAVVVAVEV